jgi:hypothetical protein
MIEVEIRIPPTIKPEALIKAVEKTCSDHDLIFTLKDTLAKYPGCVHWHVKRNNQSGTLEITWWEKEHRLWFKVADHRTGTWIGKDMPVLKEKIEHALHKK